MQTLIAEDLLLLLLDDDKGSVTGTSYPQTVLGGALLVELALMGAVEIEARASTWKSAKVRVTSTLPENGPLRAGYDLVAERERSAQDLVARLGKDLQDELAGGLVQRGILERHDDKVLGLFHRTRWPAVDSTHEAEVRQALTAVLVQGAEPDPRTGALIALLSSIDRAHKVVEHEGMPSREIRHRAKGISEGAWAAKAVKDAIAASTAAITAAVVASSAATVASS